MRLKALLENVDYKVIHFSEDKEISFLAYHSEKCCKHSAFFAIKGRDHDGHCFLEDAYRRGAKAFIVEDEDIGRSFAAEHGLDEISVIKVKSARRALARASVNFYNNPSKNLLTIGVTGTKGKTTTAFMIKEILSRGGIKTGIIGTVYQGYDGNLRDALVTTPQSWEIQTMLNDMVKDEVRAVVMEVSSQGIMQDRVYGIDFDICIFTNIYYDHIGIGEHQSFEEYLYWKCQLFKNTKKAIINIDNDYYSNIIGEIKGDICIGYGLEKSFCKELANSRHNVKYMGRQLGLIYDKDILGLSFVVDGHEFTIPMPGEFNCYNGLAAIATCREVGIDWETLEKALASIKVPGRLEQVFLDTGYKVYVDYAHNGEALKSLLKTLKKYSHNRIILVFGCGGQRDKSRRFEMGKIAGSLADVSVITSDNPRMEEPNSIINDIVSAMDKTKGRYTIVSDRYKAIEWALRKARDGDIVVVAGKGHESYQILGEKIIHFDDREEIIKAYNNIKTTGEKT